MHSPGHFGGDRGIAESALDVKKLGADPAVAAVRRRHRVLFQRYDEGGAEVYDALCDSVAADLEARREGH